MVGGGGVVQVDLITWQIYFFNHKKKKSKNYAKNVSIASETRGRDGINCQLLSIRVSCSSEFIMNANIACNWHFLCAKNCCFSTRETIFLLFRFNQQQFKCLSFFLLAVTTTCKNNYHKWHRAHLVHVVRITIQFFPSIFPQILLPPAICRRWQFKECSHTLIMVSFIQTVAF